MLCWLQVHFSFGSCYRSSVLRVAVSSWIEPLSPFNVHILCVGVVKLAVVYERVAVVQHCISHLQYMYIPSTCTCGCWEDVLHGPLSWNHFKMTGGAYDCSVSIERSRYHMSDPVRFTWLHSSRRRVPGLLRVTEFTFLVEMLWYTAWDTLYLHIYMDTYIHIHTCIHIYIYICRCICCTYNNMYIYVHNCIWSTLNILDFQSNIQLNLNLHSQSHIHSLLHVRL